MDNKINYLTTNDVTDKTSDIQSTVKPAYVVTSIKQPPLLKGHNFLDLS
jgi:hypothetical protein